MSEIKRDPLAFARPVFRTNAVRAHAAGGIADVRERFDPPSVTIYWLVLLVLIGGAATCTSILVSLGG